ncbi:MAG: OmpH family outer membrane protein [Bacteroidales bacterium]|nr:OmpH family outer membrane protein [Bacteroidales bacterium]
MKKLQLIVNIIFALAIAGLYVIFFTGIAGNKTKPGDLTAGVAPVEDSQIFYVQIDTVLANYDMAIDMADELEKSFQSSDAEFATRQNAYQKEVTDYQDRYNRGLLTRSEATNIEQQLYTKQQELLAFQQSLSDDLTEQQTVMNRQLIDAIMQYLNVHSQEYNYRYVLGTSFGGNILYANESLDITQSVIDGLNEAYREQLRNRR